jgi:hypothetical protein
MASAETTRVAQADVIKAIDVRIEELQKLLASLKRDRRRMVSHLETKTAMQPLDRLPSFPFPGDK